MVFAFRMDAQKAAAPEMLFDQSTVAVRAEADSAPLLDHPCEGFHGRVRQ